MNDKIENIDKIVQHWLVSADKNQETMTHLVDSKDYSWALFLGHLVIEKTLKALDTASSYINQLPTELDVRKAYLFGSCAKGFRDLC